MFWYIIQGNVIAGIIVATHCMVRNEGGLEEQRKEGERENQIIDV